MSAVFAQPGATLSTLQTYAYQPPGQYGYHGGQGQFAHNYYGAFPSRNGAVNTFPPVSTPPQLASYSPAQAAMQPPTPHRRPPENPVSAPGTDKKTGKDNFPPALNRYVQRCLKTVTGDAAKTKTMRARLKDIIANAIKNNLLWYKNWDLEVVPFLEDPRNAVAMAMAPRPASLGAPGRTNASNVASSVRSTSSGTPRFSSQERPPPPPPPPQPHRSPRTGEHPRDGSAGGGKKQATGARKRSRWDEKAGNGKKEEDGWATETAKKQRKSRFTSNQPSGPGTASKKQKVKKAGKAAKTASHARSGASKNELRKVQKINLNTDDEEVLKALNIHGTCQRLEKDFFRLTSVPLPEEVRPRPVLLRAFARLERLWEGHRESVIAKATKPTEIETSDAENPISAFNKEQADTSINYEYLCSQIKAIRQDLRIQRINDVFTVEVYETHARWALQCHDMNEYAGCQTRLAELYRSGLQSRSIGEFTAYNLLYLTTLTLNKRSNQGGSSVLKLLREIALAGRAQDLKDSKGRVGLSSASAKDPSVAHALRVRAAVVNENHFQFFKLLRETPHLGDLILLPIVDTFRALAIAKIVKGYKPSVPRSLVARQVGLEDQSEECEEFLRRLGVPVDADGNIQTRYAASDRQRRTICRLFLIFAWRRNVTVDISRAHAGASLL